MEKKRQHGVTLVELAVVIAVLSIVMSTLFPTLQGLLSQITNLRNDRFEVYVSESLSAYYSVNFNDYVSDDATKLTVTHITGADLDDINSYATDAVANLTLDFNNNTWHYTECAIKGVITAPINLHYCSIVGYTTPTQATLVNIAALTTPADWAAEVTANNVDTFVVLNGRHVVQRNLLETQKMVENVRDRLEDYYKNLLYSAEDQSYTINRFANGSNAGSAEIELLYDNNSALDNTVKTANNNFSSSHLSALGLTDGDVNTPFGGKIVFDNASANTRNPENGDSLPYTARVWTEVVSGVAATEIEAIAVSKF